MGLMFSDSAVSDRILAALMKLRQPGAFLPPDDLLDRRSVLTEVPINPANGAEKLNGLRIAVDLDDTLLHNSQTCPALWTLGGYEDPQIRPGYTYDHMKMDLRGRLRRLRGRARYDTVDKAHHPSLRAPRVVVAPNLPLLALLSRLRAEGAELTLATASARIRVDYLTARLPVLRQLFGSAILTAEDLAMRSVLAAKGADNPDSPIWQMSAPVHAARPLSLITKTPWALAPAFGGAAYDFLIDDHPGMAALFEAHGLEGRLVRIPGDAVAPAATRQVAEDCRARIAPEISLPPSPDHPVLRIEDPFYWPCMHVRDQLEWKDVHG